MTSFRSSTFALVLLLNSLVGLHAEVVPGTANLWLAGQADGTAARITDAAPAQSPVESTAVFAEGDHLTFDVTGGTVNAAGPVTAGPDGSATSVTHFNEFGLADLTAPLNSLVGVFINDDAPAEPYPSPLQSFGTAANRDYTTLTPGLGQPFFIGNGRTGANAVQEVRVPPGATRLFLGSMDTDNNNNNSGSFTVTVNVVPQTTVTLPTPDFSLDSDIVSSSPYFEGNPWTFRGRIATTSAFPALPADAVVKVQYSETPGDLMSWVDVTDAEMDNNGELPGIGTAQTWQVTTTEVPSGTALYFRIFIETTDDGEAASAALGPYEVNTLGFMFPSDAMGVYPEGNQGHTIGRTRKTWEFQAFQSQDATLPGLSLKMQYSTDPLNEPSWKDLPNGAVMTKDKRPFYWKLLSYIDLPVGTDYSFRTVSSAPGYHPSAGTPIGPFEIRNPGEFQFDRKNLYVDESISSVVLRINRIGGTYDKVKVSLLVDKASTAGKADYGKFTTSFTFLDGESTKTVSIPIVNDALIEGAEFFRVSLVKPTNGAGIASEGGAATVQIIDNEVGTPIPAFASFSVTPPTSLRNGDLWKFAADIPATQSGLFLLVQSTTTPGTESTWTALPGGGLMKKKGKSWVLDTNTVRVGAQSFRVVAAAPGYQERISNVIAQSVNAPLPPQVPTVFGKFIAPVVNQQIRSGDTFPVRMEISDPNGLQLVTLQYSANGTAFKDYPSGSMGNVGGSIYEKAGVFFTGSGQVFLRVKAVDGADPSATSYSASIALRFGVGGGSAGPTFGALTTKPAAGPFVAGGNLEVFLPVQDDREVKEVRLYSSGAGGNLIVEAGLMAKGKNSYGYRFNGLYAGTYFLRAVATDFDGNSTMSANFGPLDVETPLAPVSLNIAEKSRHVPPKPKFKDTNDDLMPDQVNGKVTVEWGGVVPPVDVDFVQVDETSGEPKSDLVRPAGSIKKSDGSEAFDAPQNPGRYRVRLRSKGREVPTSGVGTLDFRVGIPFNYYNTFKDPSPDFGLYWFRKETDGLRAIPGGGQNDDYFRPDRPTVIYVHGWQIKATKDRSRENWNFLAKAKDQQQRWPLCTLWRDMGYNVGIFYWNPFADDTVENKRDGTSDPASEMVPYRAEAKIYGTTGELNNQPAGMGMSYRYLSENAKTVVNEWDKSRFEDTNVADLFRSAWIEAFRGYVPNKNTRELRLVSHSLGTQLSARAMYLLRIYPEDGVPLPTRLALLEIAETDSLTLPGEDPDGTPHAGFPPRDWQLHYLQTLAKSNVAIESYRTTDLQNLLGIRGIFNFSSADTTPIHDLTAFCRLEAGSYNLGGGREAITTIHGDAIRWYFESFRWLEPPIFSYNLFGATDTGDKSINARSSWTKIRNHMKGGSSGGFWFEQTEGKGTLKVDDDAFKRNTR